MHSIADYSVAKIGERLGDRQLGLTKLLLNGAQRRKCTACSVLPHSGSETWLGFCGVKYAKGRVSASACEGVVSGKKDGLLISCTEGGGGDE